VRDNCQILVDGNVTAAAFGGMADSTFHVGVADGVVGLPGAAADFDAQSNLSSFVVKGIFGEPVLFRNAFVAAWTVTKAVFRGVETDNGGLAFGASAVDLVTLNWVHDGTTYTWGVTWPGAPGDFVALEV
jgi:hypothetical protein